jgi:hypothetical protein
MISTRAKNPEGGVWVYRGLKLIRQLTIALHEGIQDVFSDYKSVITIRGGRLDGSNLHFAKAGDGLVP